MLQRQGLPVHADRQKGIPAVRECLQRRSRRPAIGAPGQHHVSAALDPGHQQQLTHRPPKPQGVADEIPTHLIGHAGDGHMTFHQRLGQKVSETKLDLPLHHARDFERPGVGVQCRHPQGGVDPIKVGIGRHKRVNSIHCHLCSGRNGWSCGARLGKDQFPPHVIHSDNSAVQEGSQHTAPGGQASCPTKALQKPAPGRSPGRLAAAIHTECRL
jgi:hypothetical protein